MEVHVKTFWRSESLSLWFPALPTYIISCISWYWSYYLYIPVRCVKMVHFTGEEMSMYSINLLILLCLLITRWMVATLLGNRYCISMSCLCQMNIFNAASMIVWISRKLQVWKLFICHGMFALDFICTVFSLIHLLVFFNWCPVSVTPVISEESLKNVLCKTG